MCFFTLVSPLLSSSLCACLSPYLLSLFLYVGVSLRSVCLSITGFVQFVLVLLQCDCGCDCGDPAVKLVMSKSN